MWTSNLNLSLTLVDVKLVLTFSVTKKQIDGERPGQDELDSGFGGRHSNYTLPHVASNWNHFHNWILSGWILCLRKPKPRALHPLQTLILFWRNVVTK